MRTFLLIWTGLLSFGGGVPSLVHSSKHSLVQLETGSSLSRVGRWNQWVFDKDNARLLLLFKGTADGVKVWTDGVQLAIGPPDQQASQALPSLPLADAESLKRAAAQEEHRRAEEMKREEESKEMQRKLQSAPVAYFAPPVKEEKKAIAATQPVASAKPVMPPPPSPQPSKVAPQPQVLPSLPVAPPTPKTPNTMAVAHAAQHAQQQTVHQQSQATPQTPAPAASAAVGLHVQPKPAAPAVVEETVQGQDHAPDPNVSPWTDVVYHAFKKDAGSDKAHLKKLLMEWLQHESDFNTRTWVLQKVEQLDKRVSLGLIQRNGNANAAHNTAHSRVHNRAHNKAHNRAHRSHSRLHSKAHSRARNGATAQDALEYSFGGQSAAEWARSLDDDSSPAPQPPPNRGFHVMSKDRRKRMVEKLLQFAKGQRAPGNKFLQPTQTAHKDVTKTVARVLGAAAALQTSSNSKKGSLAENAQDGAMAAAAQSSQAAARAKAAAQLAQKQAAEAAAAQKAQAAAAEAAEAQNAAAAQAAQKAQAAAEAAAAAQKAQAKVAAAAAAQKAAEAAAARRAQQAAEAAAAAQKAASDAIAEQKEAEAAAKAAAEKAARAAAAQKKMLHKQLKKLLKNGKEAWITQAVQSATSLADAKRKYNKILLNAQMEAAKNFQLAASNSLVVKVSNDEMRELSFSGMLVGDEGVDGAAGPVTAQGSWHIALPQVKQETDAGTMTLAPDTDKMVFVMLGGGRYSAVLPLRPGAGKKLIAKKWREVQESPGLETLPAGGTVSAPLKGVGQFWQAWKKKKAALAKKRSAQKLHKNVAGAHHRTEQTIVNPLAMAAPPSPASKPKMALKTSQQQLKTAVSQSMQAQPLTSQIMPPQAPPQAPQTMQAPQAPQPMQAPPIQTSGPVNPIDSAILAVASQSQPPQAHPVQPVQPRVQPTASASPIPAAPMSKPALPRPVPVLGAMPPVQMSPYSAPVSAVDDVITQMALSNSKLPSSWTAATSVGQH